VEIIPTGKQMILGKVAIDVAPNFIDEIISNCINNGNETSN
jgi:hypothetical protein